MRRDDEVLAGHGRERGALIGFLEALVLAGVLVALGGLVLAFAEPAFFTSANRAGIPRWAPHGLSAALAALAVATRAPHTGLSLLAAFWAFSAAAFARPAYLAAGLAPIRFELALLPLAILSGLWALRPAAPVYIRIATALPLALSGAVGLVLWLPHPSHVLAAVYPVVLVAAFFSAVVAAYSRRPIR